MITSHGVNVLVDLIWRSGFFLPPLYVSEIQPVNAAYLDCGACGNNVLKLAELFPDRNHINCTMITGLQITNCSDKNANT